MVNSTASPSACKWFIPNLDLVGTMGIISVPHSGTRHCYRAAGDHPGISRPPHVGL